MQNVGWALPTNGLSGGRRDGRGASLRVYWSSRRQCRLAGVLGGYTQQS